ncbi:DUF1707 domain-containing protein [Nocardioides sp. Bht2]|uniref:DUF1707 SHOCT-like domain-containing protein n=1 Tax=Nocardioides sp. Bht2 TaxID=3392297 RepID=UPI0039B61DDE
MEPSRDEPQQPDPSQWRISDADRHQVAEVLRRAAGEGRLDLDELDERLDAAYAAKVYADLPPILADLPEQPPRLPEVLEAASVQPVQPTETSAVSRFDTSVTIMGGQARKGVWEIGATHNAFALMGGVDLDLRQAVFASQQVEITACTIMGGIDIIVNAQTKVIVDGIGIMGDFSQSRDRVEASLDAMSPVVRVKGFALMGAVTVTRKPMPTPRRKRLR